MFSNQYMRYNGVFYNTVIIDPTPQERLLYFNIQEDARRRKEAKLQAKETKRQAKELKLQAKEAEREAKEMKLRAKREAKCQAIEAKCEAIKAKRWTKEVERQAGESERKTEQFQHPAPTSAAYGNLPWRRRLFLWYSPSSEHDSHRGLSLGEDVSEREEQPLLGCEKGLGNHGQTERLQKYHRQIVHQKYQLSEEGTEEGTEEGMEEEMEEQGCEVAGSE
ncbi:hypothetical protein K432DRAFT_446201 [Lepidopterella palustris CBS 459.81]|uniref:Uncharacterized protein n=1 Tax=Lepidopterella palustris CBS 459.81 TaxID=1314670 RepID=A0A8E2JBC4_9PEZI|nr:hypothetical protein K432DRAFT_446201 [Lepidopterella palustris CBS 459.81]